MLFYIKCPSCSRILSYDLDKYHEDMEALLEDPGKTKKQKEEMGAALINKYGFEKYCCRSRILGLIPYHKIIQS